MPEMSSNKAPSWLARLALALTLAVPALAAAASAQAPGDYPHLSLSDRLNPDVPGPAGPWDNSHVFQSFAGQSFDAKISYQSAGQLNTHVFWALLVSVNPTPFPKNVLPPKLLTMPPFLLVMPPSPTLNTQGKAQMTLFVPAGLFAVDAYVQGLVYDSTHAPPTQLSNGLKVDTEVPGLSVDFAFVRNEEQGPEGNLGDAGVIDIDSSRLNTLKPLGPNAPPAPFDTNTPPPGTSVQVENPVGNFYAFQPIVANAPDGPVNPLARPFTTIVGNISSTATTITVQDTSFFPKRGRLLISLYGSNLWDNRPLGGTALGEGEVVLYDGKTPTSFLNCQRLQVGSQTDVSNPANVAHATGEIVAGEYTLATTAGARARTRVGLDADNPDLPHVVLPDISVTQPGEGGGPVTQSLDLYRYERATDKQQAFMTFERRTAAWTAIPGTARLPTQGVWDPMICVAPDNKSFIAVLRVNTGTLGWANDPDEIWAVRLDGQNWPASGAPTWKLTYQLVPNPTNPNDSSVRSRKAIPRCFAIVGADPANYVLYAGLAHKWRLNQIAPGQLSAAENGGFEAEYIREEVLVKDLIEVPLVPPGSTKLPPAMPRPWIVSQFPKTGTGFAVTRFDPAMLVSDDHTRLLIVAGRREGEEDAYVIRNVAITAAGAVTKTLANITGAPDVREYRAMSPGGHGQGRKAAFSPNGQRVALVSRVANNTNQKRDWLDIALTNGANYGQVKHVYGSIVKPTEVPEFIEQGAYMDHRVISGLHFLDDTHVAFLMGRCPYDDPLAVVDTDNAVAMEWFVYNVTTGVMTNLSKTYDLTPPPGGSGVTPFTFLGKLSPGGFFDSPNGEFTYLVRFGGIGAEEGSSLPAGTQVTNILGLSRATLGVFPVTGDELGFSPVPNLALPATECLVPVETAAAMRFTEATGVQADMLYFTDHVANGNGSDEIFALNRNSPFVTLQATSTNLSGLRVRNLAPDPYSGKVAFSRSGTSTLNVANEHPYVVDLDHFLFERDILPTWSVGGNPIGRVMDGSFHFIAPSGSAEEALIFSFGLLALPGGGVAQSAPPAYYPLATVSDPLAEPIPVLIPLIDTALLGGDFRFYVLNAGPSKGD